MDPALHAVKEQVGVTNLLDSARNLDAILVALRSNGQGGIKNSSIQTCYANGLGMAWGMVWEWSQNQELQSTKHQTAEGLGRHDVQRE